MVPVKRKLFDKLVGMSFDKEFTVCVVSIAGTDENFQKIIDFIDSEYEAVSKSDIVAFAMLLYDAGKKKIPEVL